MKMKKHDEIILRGTIIRDVRERLKIQ